MKNRCLIAGFLLIFVLLLAACSAGDKPDNIDGSLDNLKNYSPALDPRLLKDTETESYAKFISLLKENPQEVRDGDIIIVTINDWPLALSELTCFAIQEEVVLEGSPFYADIFRNLMDGTLMLAMAEEKNVLPTQEELAQFVAEQKQEMLNVEQEDLTILESAMEKLGISIDDYLAKIQPYSDYRNLAAQALLPLFQEEIVATEEYKTDEEYWSEYMSDFMNKAEIKYITEIPELQFTY
ncbi:MAG: hypothetical protein LBB91_09150 [Clostridiales bacterium]|jgi:6-pyruvoyl-tetrahydropterin synthase|nr:hypothetical protein [Clostridiales bacterium]